MRVALDTNVLAYAEGVGVKDKRDRTIEVLRRFDTGTVLLPVQTLGELFRVLTGKAKRTAVQARAAVFDWADAYPVADSTWSAFQAALDLCADHGLSVWDALILAVAAEQRCRVLLSEDLQNGFTHGGVTVVNPYAKLVHPLLAGLWAGEGRDN